MKTPYSAALHTDLYEITMSQVYWRRGMKDRRATFSLFFRGYPENRAFYIAAGVQEVIQFLEDFRFSRDDIQYLESLQGISNDFVQYLAGLSFTGSVRALPEGTIAFDQEPIIEVSAPVIEAQIVETIILNIITTASLSAIKAARVVKAAQGRAVVDFASRRTHGINAAMHAARSSFIAGFSGTSNLRAAATFGIPAVGTMAHSFIQTFVDERKAFQAYVDEFPQASTLLVDTYDTLDGVSNAIQIALSMKQQGQNLNAIRLDSGDLQMLARRAREMLDQAGLEDVQIVASGGLDEYSIQRLTDADTPIDVFGVGTRFGTSADAPYIDSAYKLVEIDGRPVSKQSTGKATLPWSKQVYRQYDADQNMEYDTISKSNAAPPSTSQKVSPLLELMMRDGKRVAKPETIFQIRDRVRQQLSQLPLQYQRLRNPDRYRVHISPSLSKPAG